VTALAAAQHGCDAPDPVFENGQQQGSPFSSTVRLRYWWTDAGVQAGGSNHPLIEDIQFRTVIRNMVVYTY
jgi:hypothetical protein